MPCSPKCAGSSTSSSRKVVTLVGMTVLACAVPAWASEDHGNAAAKAERIFAGLQERSGAPLVLAAIGLAVVWGAGHALSPGHGKALVGAYLIRSRGRYIDAVWLGTAVTLTHTFSVILLGIGSAWLLHTERDREKVLFCLELASAGLGVAFGIWLLISRAPTPARGAVGRHRSRRGHHHDHHNGHGHPHGHSHDHELRHPDPHAHHQGDRHGTHRDGQTAHAHPQADELQLTRFAEGYRDPNAKVRLGELLALGISGGIVPCPSALVIVLLGLHFRAPWTALALVVAFSVGLAAVLVAVGCMLVGGSHLITRSPRTASWMRIAPLISAAVILFVGLGMAGASLARHGLLRNGAEHGHVQVLHSDDTGRPSQNRTP